MRTMDAASPKTIRLNVGGRHFEVSRGLLEEPGSMLARLVSDTWNDDSNEATFIDRDGDLFAQVLGYLRYGSVELPANVSRGAFRREMDYYGLAFDDEAITDSDAVIAGLRDRIREKDKQRNRWHDLLLRDMTYTQKWDALVLAAQEGDDALVARLLALLTNAQRGDALVRAASTEGDDALAARLIANGVAPNAVGSRALGYQVGRTLVGWTPLIAAIGGRRSGIIDLLLEADVLSLLTDAQKGDVLFAAVMCENEALAARLIKDGMSPTAVGSVALANVGYAGREVFAVAIWNRSHRMINLLLGAGVLTLLTDEQKGDALVVASYRGDEALVARLIADAVGLDAVGSATLGYLTGFTALRAAIDARHQGMIDQLLEAGVLAFLTDELKGDELVRAAYRGDGVLVSRLIADGVDPNAIGSSALNNWEGTTALASAIEGGHQEVFEQLLAAGANCEKESRRLRPLMVAAECSRPNCLRQLLAAGALVDAKDTPRPDLTALHCVAFGLDEDSPSRNLCARLLLDEGADKDARGVGARTPLMWAATRNCPDLVTMLLQEGADRALVDDAGKTALELAEAEGHEEVVALLLG